MLSGQHPALKINLTDNLHRFYTIRQTTELYENKIGSEKDILEFVRNCQIFWIFMRVPELLCFRNSLFNAEIMVFKVVPQGMLFIITVSL